MRIDDTWLTIDLPLPSAIVEVEREGRPGSVIDALKVTRKLDIELDADEVVRAVLRLSGGDFIDATVHRSGGGEVGLWLINSVRERGRRVTGQWPPDDAYLSLLQVFQDHIDNAVDEPTKSKLRTALTGFVGVGRDIGVDLGAEWLKRMAMG
jgi:hypothetical protein